MCLIIQSRRKKCEDALQKNAFKVEATPTDDAIVCLPAKEQTKFSVGAAK
jgi:hypothetical protein